ncbi:ATP-binding protein [Streptomyces sp. NPDC018045]|uniref:ATP-binding protein n=1 Tax=Streptomyces sp. NPDC018045 TaxID=3365037 RepID=UPI0037AF477B
MNHRYRVLGATQAHRPDGTEVPVKGARLRALLAALAAGGGRPVPAHHLIAQVWGEDAEPPVDAPAALQALVGRLRRALGGPAVTSSPGGYGLAAGPDAIDLFRFERLAAEGTAALRAGDPAKAADLLDEALALWRGPALADLPGRDSDPLAVRVERRRGEARRARLAAEVALGRAVDVLAELAALAAAEPLDEPLQALRIRALSAAGRQAEALQAYEDVRAGLAGRLGADPGAELRALHAHLLAGSTEPATAAAPAAPAPPGNLRARLTSFVGRADELAALTRELSARRLVTLLGTGGVGKTRLALEAADTSGAPGERWPDGVWVAELASVRDEESVPEAVLSTLGGRTAQVRAPGAGGPRASGGLTTPFDRLVERCGQRRMLLVLDNCEHVLGAAAELAHTVLTRCPGVTVLATSRAPLAVPGESVRPVEPLSPRAALRLLAERGAAARPGFRTEDDPAACAEICRRLDGLPLAVELAAARLRALTPRQIAERLDDRFRLLNGGSRTSLPRQRTLRAVVDWSWDLLTADERAVLRRLSVFSGGCEAAEAERVCAAPHDGTTPRPAAAPAPHDGPRTPADVLDALTSLVDKSLVTAAPESPRGMRYRLLETVAEYAGERLTDSGERAAVERRHLTAYRELARAGEPELRGPGQARWLERLETEHDNVRAALRTAVARAEEQEALCLALSMSWFWQVRNHQADARHWAAAVADLGPDPFADPVRPAEPLAERCTAVPPPWSGERLREARRGVRLLVLAGDSDPAGTSGRVRPEAVVAAYRPGLPQTVRQPGVMWFFARLMTGGFAGLDEAVDAMVRHCRELGDGWDLGLALLLRTKLLDNRPAGLEQSARDAEEALALFEAAGDLWGIAESLSARGGTYERRGQYARADADFERAMQASVRIGAHAQVPEFKARLAAVRLESTYGTDEGKGGVAAAGSPLSPRVREAERLLLEAVAESRASSGETLSTARLLLARHYGRTGRTGLAREQLHEAQRAFTTGTPALFTGMVTGLHGWLDCLDGDFAGAREHIRQAVRQLGGLAPLVAPYLITHQFLCAAWAMAHLGAAGEGARLLGAYDRHAPGSEGFGFQPLPPAAENRVRRRAVEALRAVLAADYEQARTAGGDLSVREAAALI